MPEPTTSSRLLRGCLGALLLLGGCGDQLPSVPDGFGEDLGPSPDIRRVEAGRDSDFDGQSVCGEQAAPDEAHASVDEDQRWGPGRHLVAGRLTVPSGVTLTIEACAEVRFAPGAQLVVEGTLRATGDPTRVLRMVSDLSGSQPGVATWGGLTVGAQGSLQLGSVELLGTDIGVQVAAGGEVLFDQVRIVSPRRIGVLLEGRVLSGSSGLVILGAGDVPVAASAGSVAGLPEGEYVGNGVDAIEVLGGSVFTGTASWRPLGVPYRISHMLVDVDSAGTPPDLRLAPGTTIELTDEILVAAGRLTLQGSDAAVVRLVDPAPDPRRVRRASLRLQRPARGLQLEHARLDGISVVVSSGEVTVDEVIAQRSCGPAFAVTDEGSFAAGSQDLTISETTACDIEGTHLPGAPLLVDVGLLATVPAGRYQGNDQDAVLARGGSITANGTWTPLGVPLRLLGPVFVEGPDAPVLTVGRGMVVEAQGAQVGLYVGLDGPGTLLVDGDPDLVEPARFTSPSLLRAPGDWVGIVFGPKAGSDSRIDGAEVSFAGAPDLRRTSCAAPGDGARGAVTVFDTTRAPAILRSLLTDSGAYGVALDVPDVTGLPDYAGGKLGNIFERNVAGDVSPARVCP